MWIRFAEGERRLYIVTIFLRSFPPHRPPPLKAKKENQWRSCSCVNYDFPIFAIFFSSLSTRMETLASSSSEISSMEKGSENYRSLYSKVDAVASAKWQSGCVFVTDQSRRCVAPSLFDQSALHGRVAECSPPLRSTSSCWTINMFAEQPALKSNSNRMNVSFFIHQIVIKSASNWLAAA